MRLCGHCHRVTAERRSRRDLALLPSHRRTDRTADRKARASSTLLSQRPLPTRRRVHADGRILVSEQPMKLGPRHAGELVPSIIEDTCCCTLHGEEGTRRQSPAKAPAPSRGSTFAA